MQKKRHFVGNFIKKYNGYLQLLFLISILTLGILFSNLNLQNEQTIIIEMLVLLSLETLVHMISNDTFQDNLCNMKFDRRNMVHIEQEETYDKFTSLISQVKKDLFISGITCSGIWNYTDRIVELLKQGINIRLLVSSENTIKSNIYICTGDKTIQEEEDIIFNEVYGKMEITLNVLRTNKTVKEAYSKEQFQIRRTNTPFTMSCVGVNLFGDDNYDKQLKVTHNVTYHEMRQCPSMILNPIDNVNLYRFYMDTLEQLWEEAEPI